MPRGKSKDHDVIDIDLEVDNVEDYNAWISFLNDINRISATQKVGIFEPKIAERAMFVEMGTSERPPMPLFRTVFDEMKAPYVVMDYFGKDLKGKAPPSTYAWLRANMNAWCEETAERLRAYIRTGALNLVNSLDAGKAKPGDLAGAASEDREIDPRAWYESGETLASITVRPSRATLRTLKPPLAPTSRAHPRKGKKVVAGSSSMPRATSRPAAFGLRDALKAASEGLGATRGGRGGGRARSFFSGLSGSARSSLRYAKDDARTMSTKKGSSKRATRTRFSPKGRKGSRYKYNRPRI